MGVVQGKVTAINMLILKSFLKRRGVKLGFVFRLLFVAESHLVWRLDLMGRQGQIPHMPKAGFIVWNWSAECAERRSQNFNTVEIDANIAEHTVQFAPHMIYRCFFSCHAVSSAELMPASYCLLGKEIARAMVPEFGANSRFLITEHVN
jgi:hypothetical protein